MKPIQVHHFFASSTIVSKHMQYFRECSYSSEQVDVNTEIQSYTLGTTLLVCICKGIKHTTPCFSFLIPAIDCTSKNRMRQPFRNVCMHVSIFVSRFHEEYTTSMSKQFMKADLDFKSLRTSTEDRLVLFSNEIRFLGFRAFSVDNIT